MNKKIPVDESLIPLPKRFGMLQERQEEGNGNKKQTRTESADLQEDVAGNRPESFTDIKADNTYQHEERVDGKRQSCSQSDDLYSPQRRFDLDVEHNNRATAHKFNPYNDNQTSQTITPIDGLNSADGEHEEHRDQQSYLRSMERRNSDSINSSSQGGKRFGGPSTPKSTVQYGRSNFLPPIGPPKVEAKRRASDFK